MNLEHFRDMYDDNLFKTKYLSDLQEYLEKYTLIDIGNTIEFYRKNVPEVASVIVRTIYDFKEGMRVMHYMRIYDKGEIINEIEIIYRQSFIDGEEKIKPHGDFISERTMEMIHYD